MVLLGFLVVLQGAGGQTPTPTPTFNGPLRVDLNNRRYFTDNTGTPIFLTGSHVWINFEDYSLVSPFDYTAYLDLLTSRGHNFIRF